MSKKKLKWALLGTARINDRIIPALKKSRYCDLYAVASRSNNNLKVYATQRNIPVFYNSYQALLKDENIDVIYIALPNHLHSKWIIKAANVKKNVLCEKPITTSIKEINKIKKVAKKNKVAVQEATMMRFHPQTTFIQEMVRKKKIGSIKYISAVFSISMHNFKDIRFKYKKGGGSLWDLGSYCISFARSVLQKEPIKVFAKKIHIAGAGNVDYSLAGYLIFEKQIEMHFFSSFRSFPYEEVTMVGDKGVIKLNVPYCNLNQQGSVKITTEKINEVGKSSFGDEIPIKTINKKFDQNAYNEEVDSFAKTILYRSPQVISLDDSKKNIRALEALLKSAKLGKLISIRK
ncbi:MAG TPA: Gfo/Idh/MocA family oxidoreductase [Pelagibacterales bacterium]|nr:Gfo/Idh/MocA family oxidoreductase [Pelagibacterales bacterium]